MREFLEKRLDKLSELTGAFNRHNFRWRNFKFNNVYIQKFDYRQLNDQDLVLFFEEVIKQYYRV